MQTEFRIARGWLDKGAAGFQRARLRMTESDFEKCALTLWSTFKCWQSVMLHRSWTARPACPTGLLIWVVDQDTAKSAGSWFLVQAN